jgi:hypothetical protein
VVPVGLFSNQKFQFGYIWEDLAMEDFGFYMSIFSTYFTAKWCILWS